jgi:hypothetical protein
MARADHVRRRQSNVRRNKSELQSVKEGLGKDHLFEELFREKMYRWSQESPAKVHMWMGLFLVLHKHR